MDIEINGQEPSIVGGICAELVAVRFWSEGQLVEPVNVAHLHFEGCWYRLYFDHGIVFWRAGGEGPEAFSSPESKAEYELEDIGRKHGLLGRRLGSIAYATLAKGSSVTLRFEGGGEVIFTCENDTTSYAYRPGSAVEPRGDR